MQRLIERSEAKAIIFDEKYLETIKKVQEKGIKTFNEILEEGRNQIKNGDQKYDNIEIDNENNLKVFVNISVKENAVIKELSSNIQARIKEAIKTT